MADKIVFKGVHSLYDGEYEFDGSSFTNRELHTIKRLSGCRIGELEDALGAGDTDVVMAIGIIALQRHGKQIDENIFWDAEAGSISMELEGDEADVPPLSAPPAESVSGSPNSHSGNGSESSSESQASVLSPTGSLPSEASATLVLPMSGNSHPNS